MKTARKSWPLVWRLGICALLLLWIFHAIFVEEGRLAWRDGRVAPPVPGQTWPDLSKLDQWRIGWYYGPRELWRTLQQVEGTAFVVSLVFMGSTLVIGALRWRMFLRVQGLELPLVRTLEISLVAQFFNAFLLGSTGGDLLKAYYAARETHHKKTEAVVTVFGDRLIGLFSMLLFACAFLPANFSLLLSNPRLTTLTSFTVFMTIACGLLVVLAFWGGVSRRFPQARQWFRLLPKAETLERSLDACRRFGRDSKFMAEVLLLSIALNGCCVLQFLALSWGLHLHLPVLALAAIVPMIICLSAIPITPSGLGVRENLYVLILGAPTLLIPSTKALSLSLLAYAGFLIWSLVGGIVYLRLRETQHLAEIAKTAEEGGG